MVDPDLVLYCGVEWAVLEHLLSSDWWRGEVTVYWLQEFCQKSGLLLGCYLSHHQQWLPLLHLDLI